MFSTSLRLYKPDLCLSAAPEAGLLPSARLGSFPDEAPRRTLQEHDRPSGNQLPGPQIAPQGLPAWLLPVAVAPAAVHKSPPTLQGAPEKEGPSTFFFFFLLSFSTVRHPVCFLSSSFCRGCGDRPHFCLLLLFFLSTSSLLSGREGLPRWSSSTAASYSVNGLSLFSFT